MIYQKDRVKYGTTTIPYQIIKTGRVKTSEVIVDADTTTITIRTPLEKNKHEIQRIVLDKAGWILQKQREFRKSMPQLVKPTFKENSTLPYLGENYQLVITRKNKQSENELQLINGEFVATINSSSKNSERLVKNLYESWLLGNAQITLREKVGKCSQKIGIAIERINIKNLRNRWRSLGHPIEQWQIQFKRIDKIDCMPYVCQLLFHLTSYFDTLSIASNGSNK